MTELKKIRIGVVGAGYISRKYHMPALKRLSGEDPRIEPAAVCDLNRERACSAAADFGFSAHYTDVSGMLERESLDGAYILVDPPVLKNVALEFLNRGIPLLLEKPPGESSEEVRELIAASEANSAACLVALNRRFIPMVRRVKELIGEQEGPPQVIEARMLRYNRTEKEFAYGTAVHSVDLMRYLGGDVIEVKVEKYSLPGNESFSYLADFKFESGLIGRLSILPEAGLESERYTIHGRNYTVVLETPIEWTLDYPGRLLFYSGRNNHFVQDNRSLPEPMLDNLELTGFLGESAHFIDCLKTGGAPEPSLADCLQSLEIAEAIQEGRSMEFS